MGMSMEVNYNNCLELFKFCEAKTKGFKDNEFKRQIATEIFNFIKANYPERITSFIEIKDVYLSLEYSNELFDTFMNQLVFFIGSKNTKNALDFCNYFMVWDSILKEFKQKRVA